MGNKLESLEAEALQLTAGERATFAQLWLASLDEDAEIEDAWAAETERRIADIASGAVQAIPIADALAQVRESRVEFKGAYIELPPPLSAPAQRPRLEAFRP
ncbi:MAG: addiction module protein [Deltaproteobacteria bacterium]|nr:addiction module protein [Deltaproteobacteria bacterium]